MASQDFEGRWLPRDYDGPRTVEEAAGDLRAIARWYATSKAHVTVAASEDDTRGTTGHVSVESAPDGSGLVVRVDGEEVFVFQRDEFARAALHTFDGADYYSLLIETERGKLFLADAYNGLGAPLKTLR